MREFLQEMLWKIWEMRNKSVPFAGALIWMLAISCAQARDFLDTVNTRPTKQIIPYIEAEGRPWSASRIIWLTPEKVTFTRMDAEGSDFVSRLIEKSHEGKTYHYDEVFSVAIFDTRSGKTSSHHAGELLRYEDGIVTIRLRTVGSVNERGIAKSDPDYEYQLKGPLGQEQPFTVDRGGKPLPPPPEKCPTDTRPFLVKHSIQRFLRSEHGCIEGPNHTDDVDWIFFRSSGQPVKLDMPKQDGIGRPVWVAWMEAYLLGDDVVMTRSAGFREALNTQTLKLLKPDGRLLIVPINEWTVTKARPTRAGMVAHWGPIGDDGLYVWRNGGIVRIADGGGGDAIEVSPDGCQVAYFVNHKPGLLDKKVYVNRLRVVDVCEGLGVARDANPFVWQ